MAGEATDELVIATAAAEATDGGFIDDGFKDGACVVIESAHEEEVEGDVVEVETLCDEGVVEEAQIVEGFLCVGLFVEEFLEALEEGKGFITQGHPCEELVGDRLGDAAFVEFFEDAVFADFVDFIDGDAEGFEVCSAASSGDKGIEELAVVESDAKGGEAEFLEGGIDDGEDLGIGEHGGATGDIDIALVEFAVAAFLGSVSAPDGLDLVAFEGFIELSIHGEDAAKGDGEVVAKGEIDGIIEVFEGDAFFASEAKFFERGASAEDFEEELFAFVAKLAFECFPFFDGGGFHGFVAEALKDAFDFLDDKEALAHLFG